MQGNMPFKWKIISLFIVCIAHLVKSQTHAFIQVDNELRYLVDGVAIPMQDIVDIGDAEFRQDSMYDEALLKNSLVFDPPFLDFKEHPIGMPKMRKVYVHNTSPDTTINLHSLSGNTMHFHCTFFQDKVIAPGQNTSYDVVYLGREEGFIENTIYIHTSAGTYRYWVKAVGTANPYRIRPLIGLKMPLNSSYTPIIEIHNPHSHNLQIVEMYSTGGDLHLELPEGVTEGEKQHWSIPGHQTKPIMRATFVARRENNHTAYIRIVPGDPVKDFMVIPVEVEVSSEQGLFFPADSLYFGVLTRHDPPVSLPLFLLNSAHKHIHIQNIITSAVNEAIAIDFKPVKIPPGTVHPVRVATVTFDPTKVMSGVKVSGKLIVKSKIAAYKLSIPFCVDMHQGAISYNSSATTFYSGGEDIDLLEDEEMNEGISKLKGPPRHRTHDLILRNTFDLPVVVYDIGLAAEDVPHLKLRWNGPVVIPADKEVSIGVLTIARESEDLRFTSNIRVFTNVTVISMPLVVYNGKLTKVIPSLQEDNSLDFGTLALGEHRNVMFYLVNENPVSIRLKGWGCNEAHCAVELMGVQEGKPSNVADLPNDASSSKNILLEPNHYAVFRIGVLSPNVEGVFMTDVFVRTQFEVINIPFRVRTADGHLNVSPSPLLFDHSFPSKVTSRELSVLSTFSHAMTVENVTSIIPDSRFRYIISKEPSSRPVIRPNHKNSIGHITFDPKLNCNDQCYTGFELGSRDGQRWVGASSQTPFQPESDIQLLDSLHDRYESIAKRSFNASLSLDTSEVQGHEFNAMVKMVWPRLVQETKIVFNLTRVFNVSVKEIVLENPASQPIWAQLIFLHQYSNIKSLISSVQERLAVKYEYKEENPVPENFVFIDSLGTKPCYKGNDSYLQDVCFPSVPVDPDLVRSSNEHRTLFERHTKIIPAKDTLLLFLKPGEKVKARIAFTPTDRGLHETMLLVRNNLTAIEPVLIEARSGQGHLNFDKGHYKWNYLQFHAPSNIFKNCSAVVNPGQPVFSFLKSFLVRNSGDLPIDVVNIRVGDSSCGDLGFQVENCSGFRLMPNESRHIDVSFSPDFSLFYVTQILSIETQLSHLLWHRVNDSEEAVSDGHTLKVKLIGTVASNIINTCGTLIPRPEWEHLVYYGVIGIVIVMLTGTLVRAYFEGEYILKTTFVPMTTVLPSNQPVPQFDKSKVFDLQAVGSWTPEDTIEKTKDETNNNSVPSKPTNKKMLYDKKLIKMYSKNTSKNTGPPEEENTNNIKKSRQNNRYNKNLGLSLSSLFPVGFGSKNQSRRNRGPSSPSPKDSLSNEEDTTENDDVASKRANSTSEASSTTESSSVDEVCPIKEDIYETIEKPVHRKNKPLERTLSDDCLLIKTENIVQEKSFEVTSKTKKAKKIKENKKNSLELPYTLKSAKVRDNYDNPHKTNMRVRNKAHANLEKSNSGPTLAKHGAYNNLLSNDVQKAPAKAVVAPRIHNPNQPLAPRDPSYSAVVLGNTKPKTKATPVGKIIPEVKHVDRSSGLGVIGQKPARVGTPLQSLHHNGSLGSSYQGPPQSLGLQDQSAYNLYMRNYQPSHMPQSMNHSWGEQSLTSPHIQALQGLPRIPYEPIRNNTMNDEGWMSFDRSNQHFQWNESNVCPSSDNSMQSAPTQSLWESLSTFSIWSSPYDSSLLPGNRTFNSNNSNMSSVWSDSQPGLSSQSTSDPNDQLRNRFDHYRRDGVN